MFKVKIVYPRSVHIDGLEVRREVRVCSLSDGMHTLQSDSIHLDRRNRIPPPTTRKDRVEILCVRVPFLEPQ
ncbi:hypothetical protein A2U01_0075427 [Trifolium medium]|uniref:Uncharacterized protein n=1 Tax=Trifolium medium TaxID=97028 RepID=A0A392SZ99_9FABA|nr:hypothetical protein [Trifolium medium]